MAAEDKIIIETRARVGLTLFYATEENDQVAEEKYRWDAKRYKYSGTSHGWRSIT